MKTTTPSSSPTTVFGGGVQNQYLRANQTNRPGQCSVRSIRIDRCIRNARGVRYTNDEKDFVTGMPEGFTFPAGPSHLGQPERRQHELDLSGTYSINESVNLYARIATGFRGASVQPAGPFGNQSVADPETNTSYEVGVKADLLDQRARCTSTCIHYEVKDQQLTAVGGASNAVQVVERGEDRGPGCGARLQAYLTRQSAGDARRELQRHRDQRRRYSGGNLLCVHRHRSDRPRAVRRNRRQPAAAGARVDCEFHAAIWHPSATANCSPTPTGLIAAK